MTILPRLSALFLLSSASVALFACSAPTGAPEAAEVTAATAQPLLASCQGTYTRPAEDGDGPLTLRLESAHGVCTAGGLHFGADHEVTVEVTGKAVRGTWAGDSNTFVLCTDLHCFQWQRSVAAAER
jgi:hypothetical protein